MEKYEDVAYPNRSDRSHHINHCRLGGGNKEGTTPTPINNQPFPNNGGYYVPQPQAPVGGGAVAPVAPAAPAEPAVPAAPAAPADGSR